METKVDITDYPEHELMENIEWNVDNVCKLTKMDRSKFFVDVCLFTIAIFLQYAEHVLTFDIAISLGKWSSQPFSAAARGMRRLRFDYTIGRCF